MKDFKKYFSIPAPPEDVYNALTHEPTVMLWTGAEAVVDARPDGELSLWEDSIVGRFISLDPDKKIIVQEWYFGEQQEQSIVTIKLHADKKGTSLELRHTNIPDEAYEDMVAGWQDPFMASLIDFYEEEEED
ncbi:MAG TPA: SRPBCC domain-containing protein [Edaphocola sp.]|nr:SRPBCC domain-containing protein [Edaphocola sp.]